MRRMVLLSFIFISTIMLFPSVPSTENYLFGIGDSVEVYVVDKKGVNSFTFTSTTLDDGSFILMVPSTTKSGLFDLKTQTYFTNWKVVSYKNLTRREFEDSIFRTYKREFLVDTVILNVKYYGSHTYINISTTLDSTRFVNFEWGKNFLYYISHVQTHFLTTLDSNLTIYTIRKGKNNLEKVSPFDTVYPGDRIYLKPQTVSVVGQVVKGGLYQYSPDFSINDYISLAGGPSIEGDLKNVKHFDKNGKKKNGKVEPEDMIVVGKSLATKIKDMTYFVSVIMNSIMIYVYISNILK
ncbi:MAG: hypothetical protein ABIN35_03115 [candidate division WOR-3 bacterium]